MKKIFSLIKFSLQNHQVDFTTGSIRKALIILSIPMILEFSLEGFFALVDIFFTGNLGAKAIEIVGVTEALLTVVYAIAVGLAVAATALVARRVGEKKWHLAAVYSCQILLLAIAIGVALAIFGFFFIRHIYVLMGLSNETITFGLVFGKITMCSIPIIILLFLNNGIFRGAGQPNMAMRSLWLASAFNIVLCPILIHFFGLKGASMATCCGRSMGLIYQIFYLKRGIGKIKIKFGYFRVRFLMIWHALEIVLNTSFQFLLSNASWIVLNRFIIIMGGANTEAGFQIAVRNFMFFLLPIWGFSNAAGTLVGQNLGAKEPGRAERSVQLAIRYSLYISLFVVLFLFLATSLIIGFYAHNNLLIQAEGVKALYIFILSFPFFCLSLIILQSLNAAGYTKVPTWINIFVYFLFQIPVAYLLAYYTYLKVRGVYFSIAFTPLIIAIIAWYYFKKGKWKEVVI
ncbi:MAG: MATE family efflux transporter [Phycisphaerales bacterium]|nr:MATE family efflux transporter [Phycisphaerales bacterium]